MKQLEIFSLCQESTPDMLTSNAIISGSPNTVLPPEPTQSQDLIPATNLDLDGRKWEVGDRVTHKKFCQGLIGTIVAIENHNDYAYATVEFPSQFISDWSHRYPCNLCALELVEEAIA